MKEIKINFRATEEEKKLVERKAKEYGFRSVSEYSDILPVLKQRGFSVPCGTEK